jgi:hypothetical protein
MPLIQLLLCRGHALPDVLVEDLRSLRRQLRRHRRLLPLIRLLRLRRILLTGTRAATPGCAGYVGCPAAGG